MGEKGQHQGLEATLFQLLELKGQSTDPLILLSLVNLMGLINLMGHRFGVQGEEPKIQTGGKGAGGPSRTGSRETPPQLANLLGSLLGPISPPRSPSTSSTEGNVLAPNESPPASPGGKPAKD
ncbi:hypothetical protein [Desulfofundulus thermosubterraneus]|uniref:Uncharacterized protein n=1 Tax=Desulfofundulus thermosubterraneus DSM 16057 TaxID=1121432 RepID=A0A1M6LSM6_9FIRM|nr:hypothetical protein [Desulfofundulus thermosubterraneus]SHJ74258.1 hypothetical protein SAMN02745219_03230 [Desulfofundulus thermosubterraneus DSM 16057]